MRILVGGYLGHIELDVEASDTIENVRLQIEDETDTSPCNQGPLSLQNPTRLLECHRALSDYDIQDFF